MKKAFCSQSIDKSRTVLTNCIFGDASTSKTQEQMPKKRESLRSKLKRPYLPTSSVYTMLPINETLPTAAVWR